MQKDRDGQFPLANMNGEGAATSNELLKDADKTKDKHRTVEEDEVRGGYEAWDDVSGAPLDLEEVMGSRREEIEYVKHMSLYSKVLTNEAYEYIGKRPPYEFGRLTSTRAKAGVPIIAPA